MTRTAFILRSDATLAVIQGADDIFDYALDHTDLLTDGDTLASSVWASTGTVTLTSPAQDGAVVSAFVAGTAGTVTNTVTTTVGRRKVTTFCVLAAPVASCA